MEQVFGRFQTMERIENYPGHFNTGVYRAVDSSTNRLVALQTVWPEDCTVRPDLIARGFPAEVAAVPKLVHPNIAEMIDFGVAGSQGYILFVAYEWVGGRSLRGLLDANARQSLVTAREILSPIAAALDYAHSRGVVHGLLYPGFVWLSDDRTPKVAGFGMANGFAEMAWDYDRCRSPLAYLAPERFYSSGNSRADQFSLAVIAYEMLEGQHPFIDKKESGNAYAIPYSRRWEALCQQPPVPLDEVFPSLPRSLLLPLGRALHPDPPQRFATCAEFVATLGQPSARGKGGFRKIEDPDRRRGQGIAGFLRTVFGPMPKNEHRRSEHLPDIGAPRKKVLIPQCRWLFYTSFEGATVSGLRIDPSESNCCDVVVLARRLCNIRDSVRRATLR